MAKNIHIANMTNFCHLKLVFFCYVNILEQCLSLRFSQSYEVKNSPNGSIFLHHIAHLKMDTTYLSINQIFAIIEEMASAKAKVCQHPSAITTCSFFRCYYQTMGSMLLLHFKQDFFSHTSTEGNGFEIVFMCL